MTNCHGETFDVKYWRAVGAPMQIATEEGRTLFRYGAPVLMVMPRNSCSGPGNVDVPVARIGAAYINQWSTFVLDALGERVWLSPARARTPPPSTTRRALVVAQSKEGSVTITTANTLERAKTQALATCGKNGAVCSVKISIDPSEARCAAMARSKAQATKVALVSRPAIEDAKKAAVDECTRATHGECTVQFGLQRVTAAGRGRTRNPPSVGDHRDGHAGLPWG